MKDISASDDRIGIGLVIDGRRNSRGGRPILGPGKTIPLDAEEYRSADNAKPCDS
jgi:hypothetical protein